MKPYKIRLSLLFFILYLLFFLPKSYAQNHRLWSKEKANLWYEKQPWPRGCNYIPSSAVNQLEMWQADTFDPKTIDRELGWAESIGFNTVRVFLHHLAWEEDPTGFTKRVNQYLTIAHKHGIATIFVIFDDCWNPTYKAGKQPEPKAGIHNSGWVRDPGDLLFEDHKLNGILEKYVKTILRTFGKDKRVFAWDLYNEPGNSGYGIKCLPLLKKVYAWASQVNPSQPLTSGVWSQVKEVSNFQIGNSDIISYHNYSNDTLQLKAIASFRTYRRPLICTEYMARKLGSRFDNVMPVLKAGKVGAINWGLVSGKTNTIYAWNEPITDGSEPKLWFHDIFRKDGTPYKQDEVNLIKKLTDKE